MSRTPRHDRSTVRSTRFIVRTTQLEAAAAAQAAKEEGRPLSDFVRLAIQERIAKRPRAEA